MKSRIGGVAMVELEDIFVARALETAHLNFWEGP